MLSFTGSLKVFPAVEPCDMRRGHNGLLAVFKTIMNDLLADFSNCNRPERVIGWILLFNGGLSQAGAKTGEEKREFL